MKPEGVEIDRSGNLFWPLILIRKLLSCIWSCRIFPPPIILITFWVTKFMLGLDMCQFFLVPVSDRSTEQTSYSAIKLHVKRELTR